MVSVLYVDDEAQNLEVFLATFRRHFKIFIAASAEEGMKILGKEEIHVLITDQRMPGTSGTQLLANAVNQYPNQVRILLTAYTDIEAIIDAVNNGLIFKYVKKPWDETVLKSAIEEAHAHYAYLEGLRKKAEKLERLIANKEKEIDTKHKRRLGLDDE